jgi:hypothetical protein
MVLKSLRMLAPLAEGALRLPEMPDLSIERLLEAGLSLADLGHLRRLLDVDTQRRVDFTMSCIARAKTERQLRALAAFDPAIDPPAFGPLMADRLRDTKITGAEDVAADLASPERYFRARLAKNERGANSMLEAMAGGAIDPNPSENVEARILARTDWRMLDALPSLPENEKTRLARFLLWLLVDHSEEREAFVDAPEAVMSTLVKLAPKSPAIHEAILDIIEGDRIIETRKLTDALATLAPYSDGPRRRILARAEAELTGDRISETTALAPIASEACAQKIRALIDRALVEGEDSKLRDLLASHRHRPLGPEREERVLEQIARHEGSCWTIGGWLAYVVSQRRADLFEKTNQIFARALDRSPPREDFVACWFAALSRFPSAEPLAHAHRLLAEHVARAERPNAYAISHWSIVGLSRMYPISISLEQYLRIVEDVPIEPGKLGTYDGIARLVVRKSGDRADAKRALEREISKERPSYGLISELLRVEPGLKSKGTVARLRAKLGPAPERISLRDENAARERLRMQLDR